MKVEYRGRDRDNSRLWYIGEYNCYLVIRKGEGKGIEWCLSGNSNGLEWETDWFESASVKDALKDAEDYLITYNE